MNVPTEVFQIRNQLEGSLFILRVLKKLRVHRLGRQYIEIMPGFSEEAITSSCDYFFGYFQSFRYFEEYRNVLLEEFRFLEVEDSGYYQTIKETESVGIHVRRGDYISDKKVAKLMFQLDLDYYKAAARKILSDIGKPAHFFIFSNDLNWVQQDLVPCLVEYGKCTIVDHDLEQGDLYDFECLKNCKHQIIANSTFSWWAAYLNSYHYKKVVAPLNWYRKCKLILKDFYPPDFIVL